MHGTAKAIASVLIPNISTLTITVFTDIEQGLKLLLLISSITYTIWKFYHDYKKSKQKKQ